MQSFHDSERVRWDVVLNLRTFKRVKDEVGVDLLAPISSDEDGGVLTQRLMIEDFLLAEVVIALVADQAEKRNISLDQLRENIGPESLVEMERAFFKEYADFFRLRKRAFIAEAIEFDVKSRDEQMAKIEQTAMERTRGEPSCDSQAAPASPTTETTPSAS